MEAATLAAVRASRPQFRSPHGKLAFAVHAFLLAEDFKLVATGAAAEDEAADFASERGDVGTDGWDSLDGAYAFRYQDDSGGGRPPLYVKCLALRDQLLVHWVAGGGSGGAKGGGEPRTLELDTAAFTTDAPAAPACYKEMAQLVQKLSTSFGGALARSDKGAGGAGEAGQQGEGAAAGGSGRGRADSEAGLREPAGVSGVGYRPPGVPLGIGAEDVVPPGMRPPGYGGGPGFPGLMEPGPHRGGGMHVGPGDPIFGPGRLGGPPGHGSLPPGARWDPIAPPGQRGFHPDDFQPPEPGRMHPDMAQPGPGRGTDWDRMFG